VADVSKWPVIFSPTVYTRVLEYSAQNDRIEIWATALGTIRCWTSRRSFDPGTRCITFVQEHSAPPVGFMGGSWRFEPLAGGRTEVVLGHSFSPVPDQPDSVELITRAVDHNSTAELDALRTVAMLPSGALLSFDDSIELAGPVDAAHEFVWAADQWPGRLPHVAALTLVEGDGGTQDMTMDTQTPDGAVHTTRSLRVGLPDRSIAYKQTTLPTPLLGHSGVWEFVGGATMRSRHLALIDPVAAAELLGPEVALEEAAGRIRRALGANSMTTMEHASHYAAASAGALA
jgi:aromatase